MKILLVNPKTTLVARAPSCPLGLLSIASYIQKKGFEVRIVDQTVRKENIGKHIKEFNPDISIALSHLHVIGANLAILYAFFSAIYHAAYAQYHQFSSMVRTSSHESISPAGADHRRSAMMLIACVRSL